MAIDSVRQYLAGYGLDQRIQEFEVSSATVELAAQAAGVEPARIAKTLSFEDAQGCLLLVTAGDARIDNARFKARFGRKARMLPAETVLSLTGHAIGGVCPFAVGSDIAVYLDVSLRRFETVFPAAGSANSAVRLTPDELHRCAQAQDWVDVCKDWGHQG